MASNHIYIYIHTYPAIQRYREIDIACPLMCRLHNSISAEGKGDRKKENKENILNLSQTEPRSPPLFFWSISNNNISVESGSELNHNFSVDVCCCHCLLRRLASSNRTNNILIDKRQDLHQRETWGAWHAFSVIFLFTPALPWCCSARASGCSVRYVDRAIRSGPLPSASTLRLLFVLGFFHFPTKMKCMKMILYQCDIA